MCRECGRPTHNCECAATATHTIYTPLSRTKMDFRKKKVRKRKKRPGRQLATSENRPSVRNAYEQCIQILPIYSEDSLNCKQLRYERLARAGGPATANRVSHTAPCFWDFALQKQRSNPTTVSAGCCCCCCWFFFSCLFLRFALLPMEYL